jgi:RNA polymerase primary sigma factor
MATSTHRNPDVGGARQVAETPIQPTNHPKIARIDVDRQGTLSSYFRQLSAYHVMTKEEEHAAASAIAVLRTAYWRRLFDYPPFVPGLLAFVDEALVEARATAPTKTMRALAEASRRLRDRALVANRRAFNTHRRALATELAKLLRDEEITERIYRDLVRVADGRRRPERLDIKLPSKRSRPFTSYFEEVTAARRALRAARRAFVNANLRLVVALAKRFRHGGLTLPDLIQEGNLGLIKAVDRFDPDKGFRFSTYARWWIRHAIRRALADRGRTVRLPVHMSEAVAKVRRAQREFEAAHGRRAEDEELAALSGVNLDRIRRLRWALVEQPYSLEQPQGEEGGATLLDTIADPNHEDYAELVQRHAIKSTLAEAFAALSPMEVDILRKRMGSDFDRGMTLAEIGEQYSLSRERIRQLQEIALEKLRAAFRGRALLP